MAANDDPKQAAAAMDQYTASVEHNTQKLQENQTVYGSLSSMWQNTSQFLSQLGDEVDNFSDSLSSVTGIMDKLVGAGGEVLNALNLMPNAFSSMANKAGTSLESVQQSLSTTLDLATKLGVPQPVTNWLASAQQGELLERSFVALGAQAGNLNELFTDQGQHLKDLDNLTAQYSKVVFDAANATGSTTQETEELAAILTKLPNLGEKFGTGKDSLAALKDGLLLAKGAGVGLGEVESALTDATNNLGNEWGTVTNNIEKGEALFARMSEVQQALGARFEDIRDILKDVANQFRFLGDNTDSAAQSIMRYSSALRDTGLTTKASLEITQKMIDNMAQLPQNVGTEAFLAQRAGMGGGLQGAMQMEMMMRQGKMGDVMRMAETALRQQFGGRIYTQAEAAQSPESTAQFMRQRMLLQSGAFGIGKGLENTQATHLLEALAKGDLGGAQKIAQSSREAIKDIAGKGEVIQKSMDSELKKANRHFEQLIEFGKIQAFQALKQATGGEVFDQAGNLSAAAQDLADQAKKASVTLTGEGGQESDFEKYTLMRQMPQEAAPKQNDVMETAHQIHQSMLSSAAEAFGSFRTTASSMFDAHKRAVEAAENQPEEKDKREREHAKRFVEAATQDNAPRGTPVAARGRGQARGDSDTYVYIELDPGLRGKIVDEAAGQAGKVVLKKVNNGNQGGH